jgi:RNA polymerase sigma-70 factor (ECF subfamily)
MRVVEASKTCLVMTDMPQSTISKEESSRGIMVFEGLLIHQETIFRICLGYSRNYAEAEDLTQEVYLKAYQSLPNLRDSLSAKDWLIRIAKNACLDRQKKLRTQGSWLRRWAREINSESPAAAEESIEARIEQLKRAVRRLPKKLRTIFVLREYGHMTYEELAAALDLNKGTVMSRLSRARQRVAAALKEKSDERR